MSRPQRLTLRARLVIIGVVGLVLTLGIGGAALVGVLQMTLLNSIDDGNARTAEDITRLLEAGKLPDPVPVTNTAIVQVLGPDGGIRLVSPGGDRLVPILRPDEIERALDGEQLTVPGDPATVDGDLRVHAAASAEGTVLVATPLAEMRHNVKFLKIGLGVLIPVLTAVLGLAIWYVVGMALRPVESLRRGAMEVRGGERLPLPKGSDEIHRLAVTLNTMLDRLEHARARQRAFVADAAHELRSPLANMRTELEVAARIGPAPDLVGDLLSDVERLGRLTDDLLLLSRADDPEGMRHRAERIDVGDLLTAVVQRYAGSRVPVVLVDGGGAATVDGDVDALRRAIGNLVDNAVRHARTEVSVRLGREADAIVVGVADDGEGVPAEDRERVFQRFTRLDAARSRDKGGSGLGLAIVRELVARHGGTVTLTAADGDLDHPGLLARVRLPAAADEP